jgi:hypothetical protein
MTDIRTLIALRVELQRTYNACKHTQREPYQQLRTTAFKAIAHLENRMRELSINGNNH